MCLSKYTTQSPFQGLKPCLKKKTHAWNKGTRLWTHSIADAHKASLYEPTLIYPWSFKRYLPIIKMWSEDWFHEILVSLLGQQQFWLTIIWGILIYTSIQFLHLNAIGEVGKMNEWLSHILPYLNRMKSVCFRADSGLCRQYSLASEALRVWMYTSLAPGGFR